MGKTFMLQDVINTINSAKRLGATHLLIVYDSWDYEDFVVIANSLEEAITKKKHYESSNSYRVMETYDLAKTDVTTIKASERRMDF